MRLNLEGNGFATINNATPTNGGVTLDGANGNIVLRTDFTFGNVSGSNGVTALEASYSYNGGAFNVIDLGTFTPYNVTDLNDLRLHSKGALSATEYLDFNRVTISIPDDIPVPGDVTGDGQVTIEDYNVIRMNFRNVGATRMQGDLTGDTRVDFTDFAEWQFYAPPTVLAEFAAVGTSPIAEPGATLLAGIAIVLFGGLRRRCGAAPAKGNCCVTIGRNCARWNASGWQWILTSLILEVSS